MSTAHISVIIATRNRARFLTVCLDALARVSFDKDRFEVLVVDNASGDATQSVLAKQARCGRLPLRWVQEGRPGLSFARNTGVERAIGECLIFLDDDAIVSPGWLAAYDFHLRVRKAPIVQGRVLAQLMSARPNWINDEMLPRFSHLDQGNEAADLKGLPFGGNCGVRREVFEKVGLFRADLGAGAIGVGEDTEFGLRAAAAGFQAVYAPEALAYHLIPPERMRRSVFLRRSYVSGLSQPLFREYKESMVRMLLYFGRTTAVRLAAAACASNSARQMAEFCDLAEHLGRIVQITRQKLHSRLASIRQRYHSNIQS